MLRTFCILALLGLGSAAYADTPITPTGPVTLSTVDQFDREATDLIFVGVVSGQSTSSSFEINTFADNNGGSSAGNSCEHDALLMMSRPGRFQLLISLDSSGYYYRCRLIRLTQ